CAAGGRGGAWHRGSLPARAAPRSRRAQCSRLALPWNTLLAGFTWIIQRTSAWSGSATKFHVTLFASRKWMEPVHSSFTVTSALTNGTMRNRAVFMLLLLGGEGRAQSHLRTSLSLSSLEKLMKKVETRPHGAGRLRVRRFQAAVLATARAAGRRHGGGAHAAP